VEMTPRRNVSNTIECVEQISQHSAVKSSVDINRQFKVYLLRGMQPMKTGKSLCNVRRTTKTGD